MGVEELPDPVKQIKLTLSNEEKELCHQLTKMMETKVD